MLGLSGADHVTDHDLALENGVWSISEIPATATLKRVKPHTTGSTSAVLLRNFRTIPDVGG